jgi:hypothetical protein
MNETMRNFMDKRQQDKQVVTEKKQPRPAVKKECAPGEILTYACGHKIGAHYLQGTKCPGCVRHAQQARRAARSSELASNVGPTHRLPDGAVFTALYDAAQQQWTGTLALSQGPVFEVSRTGVFQLLRSLDAQYRRFVQEQTS